MELGDRLLRAVQDVAGRSGYLRAHEVVGIRQRHVWTEVADYFVEAMSRPMMPTLQYRPYFFVNSIMAFKFSGLTSSVELLGLRIRPPSLPTASISSRQ